MSFDTLAPLYRPMEAVLAGGLLQQCRTQFLKEAAGCQKALLLGEGPGRFLVELRRAYPELEITCVEKSEAMIQQAKNRLNPSKLSSGQIVFHHSDIFEWQPRAGHFDLIVTHFFLDCFAPEPLQRLITKVSSVAGQGAKWLLADFCIPPTGFPRWRASFIHKCMYAFFRKVTRLSATKLTPPDPLLQSAGFQLADRRTYNLGLLHSDLWIRQSTPVKEPAKSTSARLTQ
jgi:ubiquinone/menaquinone biosynthesis C-methylase UbiE